MTVSAQEVINALFNPSDTVCLRVFDDRKKGIFKGCKIETPAGKFASVIDTLKEHNSKNRGIFYVVNFGGHEDKDIKRINAQFVEIDDKSFEQQMQLIEAFPLKPSMIIKTRKSLHTYWFMDNSAQVSRFRTVQKALAGHFGGDPSVVNESRVLRLPGFNHCKEEPIPVECILFHPERKYSQNQLLEHLSFTEEEKPKTGMTGHGTQKGLDIVLRSCDFLKHCKENAGKLSESDWYAMITNLSVFKGGYEAVHELSGTYPGYSKEETDAKISHFLESGTKPMCCRTIAEKGYVCPHLDDGSCTCRSPAARCYVPLDTDTLTTIIKALPRTDREIEDIKTAKTFVEDYLFNVDSVTAQALITYELRYRFDFRKEDIRPLLSLHKELYRHLQSSSDALKNKSSVPVPDWYEMTESGPRLMPGILAKHMADNENTFYAAEEYHHYEDGVYRRMSELEARNTVREKLLLQYAKLSQITDAEGQWKMQITKDMKDLNPNPFVINLKNGLYNILEDSFSEHTPSYPSTVQLNARYVPGSECPRFMAFLHESLPDDQIPLVQEMLGYFLIPTQRCQKCFLIVGVPGAGKSKLLQVLNEVLLGKENVSNVTWQALNERFKPAELYGKLANIFADLPTKNIDDNGIFKALVGEDYMTVEKKNKNPFSFLSVARLMFSCNSIPKNYGDKSDGFYRRLIIIRFEKTVPVEKRDPSLIEKFHSEAEGILLFAIDGLKRLISRNWIFSETERNRNELVRYKEDSNSVLAFIKDCTVLDETSEVSTMETYNAYKTYCEKCGLSPYSQKNFTQEIRNSCPSLIYGKDKIGRRHTWRGLRLEEYLD